MVATARRRGQQLLALIESCEQVSVVQTGAGESRRQANQISTQELPPDTQQSTTPCCEPRSYVSPRRHRQCPLVVTVASQVEEAMPG